jgi:MHS family proline/betaine transporter-like MFS transporter
MLLGSGVAALTTSTFDPSDLHGWGWRVPFLFGILVGLVGLWLRMGLAESPQFTQAAQSGELTKAPVMVALRQNFPAIVITFCLALPIGIGFYIPFVWFSTWLAHINQPPLADSDALTANTLALAASQLVIPLAGILSDRVGRKPMLLAGLIGYIVFTYPLFVLVSQGTFMSALVGQLAFAGMMALCAGALPATFAELFPTQTRYSGIAVGYNASQALFGGTSPVVATWLIQTTGYNLAPAVYLVCMSFVAVAALFWVRESAGQPLN